MKRLTASLMIMLLALGIYANSFMGKHSIDAILPDSIDLDKILISRDLDNKNKKAKN